MPKFATPSRIDFAEVKAAIHRKLIQKLDLQRVTQTDREEAVQREVTQIIKGLLVEEATPMTLQESERLSQEVLDEVFGLGRT